MSEKPVDTSGKPVNMSEKPVNTSDEPVNMSEKAEFDNSGIPITYGGKNGKKLMFTIVFIATTGFSLFGYDQGLMSGIIASRQFNREFPQTYSSGPDDVHGGTIQGTVTAIYEVGCFFGAMFAYFFGERLGRRHMMLGGAYVMIIGTIIQVTAFGHSKGFLQFMIGRTVTGLGNGANTSTIPSWVAETSKAHNRGFLICMEASTVAVGTAIAYWLDFGLSFVDTSVSWRFPTAFQIVFATILIAGVWVLPESPRWLLSHGYEKEGTRVVAALAGTAVNDPATMVEKQRISDAILNMQGLRVARKRDILLNGKKQNLRRVLVGSSTQLFQQLGGCNAVIYYSTILFERQIGLETQLALILGGVLSIVYALSALTSFLLVERVGRRRLFLIGTVGQAVAMFIVFGCLYPQNDQAAKGAAFGLYLFIIFFGSTWLPLPWLYPAEINSLAVRTQANAFSTMTNWLMNFLVVQVLPTMTASIGPYTFLLFALANMSFLPIIYLYYPETTGRTLEELDILFAHAHLTKRRPTVIAKEMPMLTEHQVDVMAARYDINGNNDDPEGFGAAANAGHPDTTIPPTHPSDFVGDRTDPVQHSGNSTRVPTPENVNNSDKHGSNQL